MIEVNGKYNVAKIYTDNVDNETMSQVIGLLNQESCKGSRIRIMPDCHAGAGCVIGTTMTIQDKVIPGLVGVDIGCGMLTITLEEDSIDFPALDRIIREFVPAGHEIHENATAYPDRLHYRDLACFGKPECRVSGEIFEKSIGSLGGGNHFIEVDKDDDGTLYLVIHTGSRRSGKDVAEYYQKAAFDRLNVAGTVYQMEVKRQKEEFIKSVKARGREKELSSLLKAWKPDIKGISRHVPMEFAYCEGDLFNDYMHDMRIMQNYAHVNREKIAEIILEKAGLHETGRFETVHNYIEMDHNEGAILRKGSVSAKAGEILLIPMNMRDGALICRGKGNQDWNYSAPHGAGRLMSRSAARESIGLEEYRDTMQGIFTTSVSMATIDESPMAYKPMDEIIANVGDAVEIIKIIRPVYNYKAGEDPTA